MQYKLQNDRNGNPCTVSIVGKIVTIPFDPDNTDYQQYLAWLEAGNTPLPAEEQQ